MHRLDSQDNTLRKVMHRMERQLSNRLDTQDKTILDVINHMSCMEQRQRKLIEANSVAIMHLEVKLSERIDRLSEKVSALDEDLVAVMTDTIIIRKHVGMPLPEED